jgi:hypothetical protein
VQWPADGYDTDTTVANPALCLVRAGRARHRVDRGRMTGVQHRQAGHLARRAPDAVPLAHHPCPEPAAAGGNAPAGSAVTSAQVGSQSGSQRAQSLGHVRRRHAILVAGDSHAGRHRATSGVRVELIWEQEVRGSNPRIPTRFFECVVSLWKQAATRRQLLPDAGRRGWVAVHVGCAVAPRRRGIRLRPFAQNGQYRASAVDRAAVASVWLVGGSHD